METQESCDRIIEMLKGGRLPGHSEHLQVKFADSGSKKKQNQSMNLLQLTLLKLSYDLRILH